VGAVLPPKRRLTSFVLLTGLAASGAACSAPTSTPEARATSSVVAPFGEVGIEEFRVLLEMAVEPGDGARIEFDQTQSNLSGDGLLVLGESLAVSLFVTQPAQAPDGFDMRVIDSEVFVRRTGEEFFILAAPTDPQGDGLRGVADLLHPRWSIDDAAESIMRIRFIGQEIPDGETLAHYEIEQDTRRALELSEHAFADVQSVPRSMTTDVWFDTDGRVRRRIVDLGPLGTMTVSYDWSAAIEIERPTSDQIREIPQESA
jgi:hypothetical protein